MKNINVLVKPVSGRCNLNCKYCFYKDEMSKREISTFKAMNDETLDNFIRVFFEVSDLETIGFAFQGGEPTLAGVDYYNKVINTVNKYNKKHLPVYYSIQTNGILLDETWAKFLANNHFLVGISIDGIKDTHDKYRVDYENNGTFDKVFSKLALLDKYHVDYNILTVVNKEVVNHIEEIYNFYKEHNIKYQQYIPCLDNLNEKKGLKEFSLTVDDYEKYLKKLFNLYYKDLKENNYISNRTFDNYLGILLNQEPESCNMTGHCNIQYVIEGNGNVYPCDFYVIDKYLLGNVNSNSIKEIDYNRFKSMFIQESLEVNPTCRNCKFYYLCRTGCRRDKESTSKLEKNFYCKAYYNFFSANINKLEAAARLVATGKIKVN